MCDQCAYVGESGQRFCPEHAYPLIWQFLEEQLGEDADHAAATPTVAELQLDLYSLRWLRDDDEIDRLMRECDELWAGLWGRNTKDLPPELRERVHADFVPMGKRFKMVTTVRLEALRPRDLVALRERITATLEDFLA